MPTLGSSVSTTVELTTETCVTVAATPLTMTTKSEASAVVELSAFE